MNWFVLSATLLLLIFPVASSAGPLDTHIAELPVPDTSERDPVAVVTSVFPNRAAPGETVTVIVKIRVQPGWRIYRYVPPTAPYMSTRWVLDHSDGVEPSGVWQKPQPEYLAGHSDILIYQGEQVFTRQLTLAEDAPDTVTLTAGLNYQTCNNDMCLRPTRKTTELSVTVK